MGSAAVTTRDRSHLERSCETKRQYTEAAAKHAAHVVEGGLRAYHCEFGAHYHLGHVLPRLTVARPKARKSVRCEVPERNEA